ncbi:MAG TPA: hypothetical protein VGO80_04335, partial [Solirubrobacteraceae bacterium]|nr:hypothetical protein [Solirubrobacteraceae bacterium]
MALTTCRVGTKLAVPLAFAHPRRAGMTIKDVQAHVGDGGNVREHSRVRTPHGIVDASESLAAPGEPDEDRLAHEQRPPASQPARSQRDRSQRAACDEQP